MFEPKGPQPLWELVYDRIRTLSVGDTITYAELSRILGGRGIEACRAPLYKAMQVLEREDKRTLDNVRDTGYRVVEAVEHERLARRHHRKSHRQLRKALGKVQSADRSKLTPEERRRFDRMEITLSRQADMIRRLDAKVERIDQAIKDARRSTHGELA